MARAVHRFAFSPGGSSLRGALRFPLRAALLSRAVIRTTSPPRLRALGRFWRWQIERRSGVGPVVVDLGEGGLLAVPRWSQIGGMIIATGSHEPFDTAFLDRLVRSGDVRENFWQANVIAVSRDRRCSVQERLAAAPPAPLTSPQVARWRDR